MAWLKYSRFYNVTTVSTVKQLPFCSTISLHPHGRQLPIYVLIPARFKASSAPTTSSAIKLNDTDVHHTHLHHQKSIESTLPLSIVKSPSSSEATEKPFISQPSPSPLESIIQNHRQHIDLTFNNTKECFKSKKTSQLMRALIVLKLCSYPMIVDNHQKLIKLGQKVLGYRLFRKLMKATFYGHFVAGENEVEMSPIINHIKQFGVKSILDYSAEDEINEETNNNNSSQQSKSNGGSENVQVDNFNARKFQATARTYFYVGEAQCEKNMEIFLNCIDSVAEITNQTGFAAVKLTALCRPQLLLKLSEFIMETQNLPKSKSNSTFNHQLLNELNESQRILLNVLSWNEMIPMENVIDYLQKDNVQKSSSVDKRSMFKSKFTQEETEMFKNLIRRIETISQHAVETDVRIMIDAEQTYLQPAINLITMEMMKKYNKSKSIVFNTYQNYLKSTFDTMRQDLSLSEKFDFYFGAKLVRGAYMEQERLRAQTLGYEDPINENFEATTKMYHKTLDYLMNEIVSKGADSKRIAIMVASHNEDTVRFAVEKMDKLSISPDHKVICFGQLYGMSDHISFSLGQAGYSVYKYVPYGPVDEVLPYLSRRAIENSSVLAKATREKQLIRKEIVRRMISGEFFQKPIGNYAPA